MFVQRAVAVRVTTTEAFREHTVQSTCSHNSAETGTVLYENIVVTFFILRPFS